MRRRKFYTDILKVYMSNNDVYSIVHEEVPDDFYYDLKKSNDFDFVLHDYGFFKTKRDCLESSGYVVVQGYGVYSGRKIHQLPFSIKNKISKLIRKVEVEIE